MSRLNQICSETGSDVVITSILRKSKTPNELQKLLEDYGFTGKVVGKTSSTAVSKGYEVALWYYNHKDTSNYVIIDSNEIDPTGTFQVLTDFNKGLTDEGVTKAIEILSCNPTECVLVER